MANPGETLSGIRLNEKVVVPNDILGFKQIWVGTQEEYDVLGELDPDWVYYIVEKE